MVSTLAPATAVPAVAADPPAAPAAAAVNANKAATGDHAAWTADKPGDLHHIKPTDLVAPFASESAGNGP